MIVNTLQNADPRLLATTGVLVGTYVSILLVKKMMKSKGKLPPGPTGLPFIGNLFQLGPNPRETIKKWADKYGTIFGMRLGQKYAVVLSTHKVIRSAFVMQGEAFAGRPDYYSFQNTICNGKTLAFSSYSERWRMQHKVMLDCLKTFMQNNDPSMDQAIVDECRVLVSELEESNGKPYDPYNSLLTACLSVVFKLVFGPDSEFMKNRKLLSDVGNVEEMRKQVGAGSNLVDYFPTLERWLKDRLNMMKRECDKRVDIIADQYEQHKKGYDEDNPRDMMDLLIKAVGNITDDERKRGLEDWHILSTAFTLMNAGTDTPAGMMYWAVAYAASYPEVQRKVFEEVNEVVGMDRPVDLNDRQHLHYTQAFLNEVMRHSLQTPMLIPHATIKDVTLNGYFIPKGTVVLPNMYSVSRDKSLWSDPEVFDPARYLDDKGHLDKMKLERFYPFGAGKRRCTGEAIGRMQISLFFASIMQRFSIDKAEGEKVRLDGNFGLSVVPDPYKVCFTPRPEFNY